MMKAQTMVRSRVMAAAPFSSSRRKLGSLCLWTAVKKKGDSSFRWNDGEESSLGSLVSISWRALLRPHHCRRRRDPGGADRRLGRLRLAGPGRPRDQLQYVERAGGKDGDVDDHEGDQRA